MAYRPVTLADLAPGRSNVADLIMNQGRIAAEGARRSGEILGSTIANTTQLASQGIDRIAAQKEQRTAQDAVRLATSPRYPSATQPVAGSASDIPDLGEDHIKSILERVSPEKRPQVQASIDAINTSRSKVEADRLKLEEGQRALQQKAADHWFTVSVGLEQHMDDADGGISAASIGVGLSKGVPGAEEVGRLAAGFQKAFAEAQDPQAKAAVVDSWRQQVAPLIQRGKAGGSLDAQKTWADLQSKLKEPNKPVSLSEGAVLVDPVTGKEIAKGAPKQDTRPLPVQLAEALQTGDTAKAATIQKAIKTAADLGRDPLAGQKEKFWVVRDGKPIRVSESEYRPGDKPANTREQGRPVTSGDAGRIADLDTSLDDLNALTGTVSGNKATGTAAKVGSMVPNFVTEFTGWGTEAKQKQATIDRVKQVIGKALEGGVLRKEDEAKYEKILPTIGDTQEVVATKLDGLWKAIQTRRQTTLESLADAGYDTAKYTARAPRERQAPESADGVTVAAPDGKTYRFKSQAQADVFKKRAGIK